MPAKRTTPSAEEKLLTKILAALQDLLIIQAATVGLGKPETRRIAGVADARVSRIWRHINKTSKKRQAE